MDSDFSDDEHDKEEDIQEIPIPREQIQDSDQLEEQELTEAKELLGIDDDGTTLINEDEDDESDTFEQMIPKYLDPTQELTQGPKAELGSLVVSVTIIRGDARKTYNMLTEAELAGALAHRATMLSKNNPPLISGKIDPDPIRVAQEELRQGLLPIMIFRPIGNNKYEEYSINELYGIDSAKF
jgi:DNA-directed RNA polymerase I, II, and III subunit RPABC2